MIRPIFTTLYIYLAAVLLFALMILLQAQQSLVMAAASLFALESAVDNPTQPFRQMTAAGEKIVFDTNQIESPGQIYIMNPDGTDVQQLTFHTAGINTSARLSPDGTQIAFSREINGQYDLFIMGVDGTNQTNLTNHPAHDGGAEWSPDGKQIVFSSDREGTGLDLYSINNAGDGLVRLTSAAVDEFRPNWSSDGTSISYTYRVGSRHELWQMNANGTNQRPLCPALTGTDSRWSPDMTKIAYLSPSYPNQLRVLSTDCTNSIQLTSGGDVDALTWSPDGTQIMFDAGNNNASNSLFKINVDGTGLTQVKTFAHRPDWGRLSTFTIDAGGPYSGDEGAIVALDGATVAGTSIADLTLLWTVDSDQCTFDDATRLTPTITCQDNGLFTTILTARDNMDHAMSDETTITINNVAPSVALLGNSVAAEGDTLSYSYTVDDPGDDSFVLTELSCGTNGTVANALFDSNTGSASFECIFPDGPALSNIHLTIADDDGGSDSTGLAVQVSNVTPTVDAGADQTVYRSDIVAVSGTWSDPAGDLDAPYSWAWDLDADGTPDESGASPYGQTIAKTTSFATEGTYTLKFVMMDSDGAQANDSLTVTVQNRAPECAAAAPSNARLWPANHKFVSIDILGVTDPEGDSITITIDSIFQDEPVVDGSGSGQTTPDGQGVGTATAEVRAERAGNGNGRVYHIGFAANDGHGGICNGEVIVGVPHHKNQTPIDDGPRYDSTGDSGDNKQKQNAIAGEDHPLFLPLIVR